MFALRDIDLKDVMTVFVQAIGTAIPEYSVDQAEATEIAKKFLANGQGDEKALATLYRMTRVEQRHIALLDGPEGHEPRQTFYPPAAGPCDRGPMTRARMQQYAEHAPPLAATAAQKALKEAGLDADRVTHIITVSCTGFESPGIDMTLIKRLGLSPSVGRVQVGFMGCHGALNGLRVAQAFAEADPQACVLLCAVELCSLHFQYGSDPQQTVANALFADGAAAVAATGEPMEHGDCWRVAACGSCLLPDSEDAMTWRIGDHGFQMTLSPQIPKLIRQHLGPWLSAWLESKGYSIDDVSSWAIHPGGPRVVRSVTDALGVPPEAAGASNEILATYGNMSSPTVLFVIRRLQELDAARPCVALGFGPGLVVEATLFV